MARKLRVEFEGAVYHVMNRGDQRERIFVDDEDRRLFLATLGEACAKAGWQIHAFCLMSNHFHLVVETPRANLSAGMRVVPGNLHGPL
jgi:REP element-mobilizing transposase RayT